MLKKTARVPTFSSFSETWHNSIVYNNAQAPAEATRNKFAIPNMGSTEQQFCQESHNANQSKSMDQFFYNRDLRHERVNSRWNEEILEENNFRTEEWKICYCAGST